MNFFSDIFRKIKKKIIKKTTTIKILAPISGEIVDIKTVPDSVFADKIIGDGIAIYPTGNFIVAPMDGTIGKIFDTNHAFSIISNNEIELFVHFGIDTINLKGNGFKRIFNFKKNNIVKKGEIIIKLDLDYLIKTAKSILTPIVISNTEDIKKIKKYSGKVIAGIDPILKITK
ncbi:PTS glucose transporter subunit IIA [Enterobacteriaceae endosymbiont of Plateumaris rustica]|uniref:PTS glucose transporter subunit IIA n=1 Tax=Enterobacteriaceae endosymbiont of Plateumaris rustica TaxID=2675796 RepID=UPI001448C94F|nr:PTS glucose transporter subunit IIA [Enterobacteriaceae endosymbiont of Plateumaris rustica]QJC29263.1 PTS glucose transporter subunit IIA [Enterobacteriaceae endosymbiont of Plateumaris rustica]